MVCDDLCDLGRGLKCNFELVDVHTEGTTIFVCICPLNTTFFNDNNRRPVSVLKYHPQALYSVKNLRMMCLSTKTYKTVSEKHVYS